VTLVFGATGGIGAALAHRLHALKSSGSSVQAPSAIVISADGDDKLKALLQQLKGVEAFPADARDPAAVRVSAVLWKVGCGGLNTWRWPALWCGIWCPATESSVLQTPVSA
jgi:nucleoside-diphosphate-sugar epimerase